MRFTDSAAVLAARAKAAEAVAEAVSGARDNNLLRKQHELQKAAESKVRIYGST